MNVVKICWVAHAELCHPLHSLLAHVNVEGLFFFFSCLALKDWKGVGWSAKWSHIENILYQPVTSSKETGLSEYFLYLDHFPPL